MEGSILEALQENVREGRGEMSGKKQSSENDEIHSHRYSPFLFSFSFKRERKSRILSSSPLFSPPFRRLYQPHKTKQKKRSTKQASNRNRTEILKKRGMPLVASQTSKQQNHFFVKKDFNNPCPPSPIPPKEKKDRKIKWFNLPYFLFLLPFFPFVQVLSGKYPISFIFIFFQVSFIFLLFRLRTKSRAKANNPTPSSFSSIKNFHLIPFKPRALHAK